MRFKTREMQKGSGARTGTRCAPEGVGSGTYRSTHGYGTETPTIQKDATLRDIVLIVRDDEAHRRDVNHGYTKKLVGEPVNPAPVAANPKHATDVRLKA